MKNICLFWGLMFWICGLSMASSIIPPKDYGQMIHLSDAVVYGKVVSLQAIREQGLPWIKAGFLVQQVIKGNVSAGQIIDLEYIGGWGDATILVSGSLKLESGQEYLLSLKNTEGSWRPWLLSYGQLRLERMPDGREMLVPVEEVHELETVWLQPGEEITGYLKDDLLQHIRAVANGFQNWDSRIAGVKKITNDQIMETTPAGCAIIESSVYNMAALPIRWNLPDGESAELVFAQGASPSQIQAITTSIQNWTQIPHADIGFLKFGGSTTLSDCGFITNWMDQSANQRKLLIEFDDSCNIIDDTVNCVGIFGLTLIKPDVDKPPHVHRGREWYGLKSGLIVINNGLQACLRADRYQLVVQHEIGHLLGFGHHTLEPATMNASCCNALGDKDMACAQYVYGDLTLNPVPVITSLDPFELEQGTTRDIDVRGSGFMPQTTVAVGGTRVELGQVQYLDDTHLRVRVTVAVDADPSIRAFRLTNPKPGGGRGADAGLVIRQRMGTKLNDQSEKPGRYALEANYPNPFNPSTVIPFEIPETVRVKISLVDLGGREIRVLAHGAFPGGRHQIEIDASNMSSGIYLVKMESSLGTLSRSIVLLK